MGMVRQWQDLLHGGRFSHSWSEALPDFVKLAEAFGCKGILCKDPSKFFTISLNDSGCTYVNMFKVTYNLYFIFYCFFC